MDGNVTGKVTPWPKDWPDLMAKDTRKFRAPQEVGKPISIWDRVIGGRVEYYYSVYLPSSSLAELHNLLPTQKETTAVSINGQRMDASYYFPFPGDDEKAPIEGLVPVENDYMRNQKLNRNIAAGLAIMILFGLVGVVVVKPTRTGGQGAADSDPPVPMKCQ